MSYKHDSWNEGILNNVAVYVFLLIKTKFAFIHIETVPGLFLDQAVSQECPILRSTLHIEAHLMTDGKRALGESSVTPLFTFLLH